MKLFPESAYFQLEFDKVKALLANYCQTDHARNKAEQLRIHTRKEFIDTELRQSHEYRQLISNSIYFPNDYILNLEKELKQIQIERQKIDEERQENRKDCYRMKSYYNSLMDRLRKMYFETIELYKATNRTYRKDGIIPDCFSDVLPQPDIKDISFTNFNY